MIKDQSAEWRILDFDVECRPIAWYGGDWVTKQPTAIAWKFLAWSGPLSLTMYSGTPSERLAASSCSEVFQSRPAPSWAAAASSGSNRSWMTARVGSRPRAM